MEACPCASEDFHTVWRALCGIYSHNPGLQLADLRLSRMHMTATELERFSDFLPHITLKTDNLDLAFNHIMLTCTSHVETLKRVINTLEPRSVRLDCNNLGDSEFTASLFISLMTRPYSNHGRGLEKLSMACCCLGRHFVDYLRVFLDDSPDVPRCCNPQVWAGLCYIGVQRNVMTLEQILSIALRLARFPSIKLFCVKDNPTPPNLHAELRRIVGRLDVALQRRVESLLDWSKDSVC